MAKVWYFNDSSGTRRKVTAAHFYDTTGARKSVKAGYFYDSAGVRRQFFAGGLPTPATGYFPGSNFTMKAGENSTKTGFSGGSYGEVKPDAGTATAFPLYPTTVSAAHQAQMLYANRDKATSAFDMYYYLSPFTNPDATTKFWAFQMFDQQGTLLDVLPRTSATETVGPNDIVHTWPYVYPFTVGSIYSFIAKELAINTSIVAGTSGAWTGFSNGQGGWSSMGSCANNALTTRTGWSVVTFATDNEELVLEIKGPTGATDPGKNFIAALSTTMPGIGTRSVDEIDSYTWNAGQLVGQWIWTESAKFVSGTGYTLLAG